MPRTLFLLSSVLSPSDQSSSDRYVLFSLKPGLLSWIDGICLQLFPQGLGSAFQMVHAQQDITVPLARPRLPPSLSDAPVASTVLRDLLSQGIVRREPSNPRRHRVLVNSALQVSTVKPPAQVGSRLAPGPLRELVARSLVVLFQWVNIMVHRTQSPCTKWHKASTCSEPKPGWGLCLLSFGTS